MKTVITEDYTQMSKAAAEVVAGAVRKKSAVLGLATGTTPIGMYDMLVQMYDRGELSFKNVRTVNLDEYVGISSGDKNSYRAFMNLHLFDRIDIEKENTHLPDGTADDLEAECERYSRLIAELLRDIQVLGLGRNGHIGFNEPGTPFDSTTHVVELSEDTVKANSRLFARESDVPRRAVTMGIAEIMSAHKIIILASGAGKARAVREMIRGEISEKCPASVLRRHGDVTLIADREAANELL